MNPTAVTTFVGEAFDEAAALLAALRLSQDRWTPAGAYRSPWAFRGQADARWPLLPSLWRTYEPSRHPLSPLIARAQQSVRMYAETVGRRVTGSPEAIRRSLEAVALAVAEQQAVATFAEVADSLGFPVAEDLPPPDMLREYYRSANTGLLWTYASRIQALAQHHGITTRLLDWTRKPLVAAFFAADDALVRRESDTSLERLSIWAIDASQLCIWDKAGSNHGRIFTLRCPKHNMAFLHAQDGLFTFDVDGDALFVTHGRYPALEDRLPELVSEACLRRLTLPVAEAPHLLRLLHAEGVSRAHLMPTLDNVARSAMRSWDW